MEHGQKTTFTFDINLYQKDSILDQTRFTKQGYLVSQCLTTITEKVQNYLEKTVIEKGFVTTHACIFCAVYHNSKLVAVVAYHPSFRYEILKNAKDIHGFIQDITPGLKL